MWVLATLNASLVQLVLGVVGLSGVGGAVIALVKLRPDINSAAVAQSQGAVETMATLARQLEEERNQWRDRALQAEAKVRELEESPRVPRPRKRSQ